MEDKDTGGSYYAPWPGWPEPQRSDSTSRRYTHSTRLATASLSRSILTMATTVTQLQTLQSIPHLLSKAAVSESLDIPLPPPTTIPTKILHIDKDTPDSHVPRDPRLIRLTGVHPFNVEAPLTELYNEGHLIIPYQVDTLLEILIAHHSIPQASSPLQNSSMSEITGLFPKSWIKTFQTGNSALKGKHFRLVIL